MHNVFDRRKSAVSLLLLFLSLAHAENWPQWRGPLFNGSTSETNLPAQWSKTNGIAWAVPLPGKSGATPVVWEDTIFLPSPDTNKNLLLFCIDQHDGKVRWKKVVATGDHNAGKNNMASCSAVTDGQRVYTIFGTGDLAAYDFAGNEIWHNHLNETFGTFALLFQYGGSPLLFGGNLYVTILQRNPPAYNHAVDSKPDRQSWLICFDPQTGKMLWKHERKTDAVEESMEAYTTPMPWLGPKGPQIIISGADCITAHRPDSGEELWRYFQINLTKKHDGRIVVSPVVSSNLIYACGPKHDVLVAVRGDDNGSGQLAWSSKEFIPDVCTPLVYQGKLFVLDGDRQMMTCYNLESGEKIWQNKLGVHEIFNASPTGADGKIFCFSEQGTVVILSAGNTFETLATIPLGEGPCSSSIVAIGGNLLIRTAENLYCVKSLPRP